MRNMRAASGTSSNRTRASSATVAVLALVGIVTFVGQSPPTAANSDVRPNIVVIEADDMRADEIQYLPKTRALLQGTTFTNSFVSTSLCCPSRAAFLSGQYDQNNRVANNDTYELFNHDNTIARWLQDSGYFTGIVGKYLNHYDCDYPQPAGWSNWQVLCGGPRVYSMFDYKMNVNGSVISFSRKSGAPYQTDEISRRAASTIHEAASSSAPFFLWITPTANHGGTGPRFRLSDRGTYAPCSKVRTSQCWSKNTLPNYGEPDVADKPNWVQALPRIDSGKFARKAANLIRVNELSRLRMLPALDDLVANTVETLKETGQFDNTVIVFTSDNGYMLGEHHYMQGKGLIYNESLRVPLIVSGPGVPVTINAAPVVNVDLAPTLAEVAGVAPQDGLAFDGRSLLDVMTDPHALDHRAILHRQLPGRLRFTKLGLLQTVVLQPAADAVRADQFLYALLTTGEEELYDEVADPYELTNLAHDPRYQPVRTQLAGLLATLRDCHGIDCHIERPNLHPTGSLSTSCLDSLVCDFTLAGVDADGNVDAVSWDFGDGVQSSDSATSTSHAYARRGTYTVQATLTDDRGDTSVVEATVSVGPANISPNVDFGATTSDLTLSLDASASSDPDGAIVSTSWDFGDGSSGSGTPTSHTYSAPGSYLVTLTVTDDDGASSSVAQSIMVAAPNLPPEAVVSWSSDGSTVSFDGSSSFDVDGNIVSFLWDFGDGSDGVTPDEISDRIGTNPVHVYRTSGDYLATLTVTDDRGAVAIASAVVTIA